MAGLHPYQYTHNKRELETKAGFAHGEMQKKKQKITYIILIKDGETDSSRWIDIRVEKPLWEFAFRRFARIILTEVHR